jgi:hypothetical protein
MTMKLQDIRTIARYVRIESNGQSKPDLIRTIQLRVGDFDCYGSAGIGECGHWDCLWRNDCISGGAEE